MDDLGREGEGTGGGGRKPVQGKGQGGHELGRGKGYIKLGSDEERWVRRGKGGIIY